uniref:Condensin complex subunit 1 C-terminal domain-containing protein n=1 Tax=Glossina austeni TaxID=7395 RepID=A0A1A9UWK0_GLOAU
MTDEMQDRLQSKRRDCDVMHGKDTGKPKESTYFKHRVALPYSSLAMPKLMKDLDDKDPDIQWKAINTLSDGVIINSILSQSSISGYDFVRNITNVFLHKRYYFRETNKEEINGLLEIFIMIATYTNGAKYILKSDQLVKALYEMIESGEENSSRAAEILAFATTEYNNVFYLQEHYNAICKLARILRRNLRAYSNPSALYRHLQWLLETFPDVGVKEGLFEILFTRIKDRACNFHKYDLKCFALLLRCPDGQKRFAVIDGIKEIYEILVDPKRKLDSYENVVYTIMTAMFTKKIIVRCSQFVDLPRRITHLAKDSKETIMQLYCFQALYMLADVPRMKSYMKTNCFQILQQINCEDTVNEKRKNELLYKLNREIYHTSGLRSENRKPVDIVMETRSRSYGDERHITLRRL